MSEWSLTLGHDEVQLTLYRESATAKFTTPSIGTIETELPALATQGLGLESARHALFRLFDAHRDMHGPGTELLRMLDFLDLAEIRRASILPLAPIRSRPERTYNPIGEVPQPEGSHIPMVLARLKSESETAWRPLAERLAAFGSAAGLFKTLDIKRKGKSGGDPFQIHLSPGKHPFNMIDVGYGISQSLPVVAEALLAPPDTLLLVQQPEVHLHPRAQAELGSLFAELVAKDEKRFIIESHSDYLLDRIRMDIRDGRSVRPSDVAVLYCERVGESVKVHVLDFDANGDFTSPPPESYRNFFLEEERRFLLSPTRTS